jgi:hypothetical protein
MTALRFGTDTGSGQGLEVRADHFGGRSWVTACDISPIVIWAFGLG